MFTLKKSPISTWSLPFFHLLKLLKYLLWRLILLPSVNSKILTHYTSSRIFTNKRLIYNFYDIILMFVILR